MASMPATRPATERTAAARAENQRKAAERAITDPVKLGRAVRIVRAALTAKLIELGDLIETSA